jgi:hypothetical protein
MIDKKKFERYEAVRASGVTNMFDVRTVCDLSGLEREEVMGIMKSYSDLVKQYPGVRK